MVSLFEGGNTYLFDTIDAGGLVFEDSLDSWHGNCWGHIKQGDFCQGSWKLVTNYIESWLTSTYFAGLIE